jgi:hypothetical protein
MFTEDLGVHIVRIDVELPSQVEAEAEAVEKCPAAQDPLESEHPDQIGQRIGRVGDDEHDRLGRNSQQLRQNLPVDVDVLIEQLEPSGGIATVRCAAGLFIHPGGDHDQRRARQIRVITVPNVHGGGQRCAILHVGRDRNGALAGPIEHDDLPCAAAHDDRQQAGGPNGARPDHANLHLLLPSADDGYVARGVVLWSVAQVRAGPATAVDASTTKGPPVTATGGCLMLQNGCGAFRDDGSRKVIWSRQVPRTSASEDPKPDH